MPRGLGSGGAAGTPVLRASSGSLGRLIADNRSAGPDNLVGGAVEFGDGTADVSAVTCVDKTGLKPGTTLETISIANERRQFYLHVPDRYDGETGVPVVIDLHGLGGTADGRPGSQASTSGWREKGDAENFITVHPVGLGASWNGGRLCCPPSNADGTDDERFMREVVENLATRGCIDTARVYATGLSNGGALAHLLACRAADLFAATAPVSMGNGVWQCRPSRPISVIMFRGTKDATVSYYGSGPFPSAMEDFEQWHDLNGCRGSSKSTHDDLCETFQGCRAGVEVTLCSPEAGNVLYRQAAEQGVAVPDVVWRAFAKHRLP